MSHSIYFYFEGDINSLIPVLALFAVSLIRLIPAFTSMSTSLYYMKYVKTSFDHVTKQIIEFKTVKNSDKGIVRDFFELKNMIASIENLNFNYQKTSKIK